MAELGFEEIKRYIPHRFPMIMVDRVLDYEPGRSLRAVKNVSGNDICFLAHFPHLSIFPGAYILEGLSQSSIILFQLSTAPLGEGAIPLFGSVQARFLKPVFPGDVLLYRVEAERILPQAGMFRGTAEVDGQVVARADLTMGLVPDGQLGRRGAMEPDTKPGETRE